MTRPTWTETFLSQCYQTALRSPDQHTKCGCVLVNKHNELVTSGYNGYIRGINGDFFPMNRPDELREPCNILNKGLSKYDFFIHAEHNAILSCARQGKSTLDCRAYVTGEPCNWCLQYLWQVGIRHVVFSNFNNPKMMQDDHSNLVRQRLISLMLPQGLKLEFYDQKDMPDELFQKNALSIEM